MRASLRPGGLYLTELTLDAMPDKKRHKQWEAPELAPEITISWGRTAHYHLSHESKDLVVVRDLASDRELVRQEIRKAHYSYDWLIETMTGDPRWELVGFWRCDDMSKADVDVSSIGDYWMGIRRTVAHSRHRSA